MRAFLGQQLAPLAQQNQANLTGIQAQAKLGLAGYGGWKFGQDNPNTPAREDLDLSFDPSSGPGEREKQAVRDTRAQFAKQGALYSSQANQNIASALQRLSMEAQQIAVQYSNSLLQQETGYANQVASVVGNWTSLYGQDAAYLAQNPPPPPPPAPSAFQQAITGARSGQVALSNKGEPIIWKGKKPPNLETLQARHPGAIIDVRKTGGGGYVAVLTGEV